MEQRVKYACNSCEYNFTRKSNITFKHCPYCGKIGTVDVQKSDKASQLLNDAILGL